MFAIHSDYQKSHIQNFIDSLIIFSNVQDYNDLTESDKHELAGMLLAEDDTTDWLDAFVDTQTRRNLAKTLIIGCAENNEDLVESMKKDMISHYKRTMTLLVDERVRLQESSRYDY